MTPHWLNMPCVGCRKKEEEITKLKARIEELELIHEGISEDERELDEFDRPEGDESRE